MVAKSYQHLQQIGLPYNKGSRMYVKILLNNKGVREVRWYSETEYKKMYPQDTVIRTNDARARFCFFPNNKLYIACGDAEKVNTFFMEETHHFGRYCATWGWYVGTWAKEFNKETLAAYKARMKELGIGFYTIDYSQISDENNNIYSFDKIKEILYGHK